MNGRQPSAPDSHFEYLTMPFGLFNAPARFQTYINDVLRDYPDDVLIYSNDTLGEHTELVRKVLICLRERGLYVELEKCEFHVQRNQIPWLYHFYRGHSNGSRSREDHYRMARPHRSPSLSRFSQLLSTARRRIFTHYTSSHSYAL